MKLIRKYGKRYWTSKRLGALLSMLLLLGVTMVQNEIQTKRGGNGKQPGHAYIIFIVAFLILTVCPSMSYSVDREMVDRIVAIVNDELITYTMLNDAFKPYEKKIRDSNYPLEQEIAIRHKVRRDLIQQLIDQKITDQELKKAQITVSDAEIDGYIERLKESKNLTDEDLRKMLASEDVTFEHYREVVKNQLLQNKLFQYQINSKIVITAEEIEAYYKDHKDEFDGKPLEDVTQMVTEKLYQMQVDEKMKKWISHLREEAQIKIIQ